MNRRFLLSLTAAIVMTVQTVFAAPAKPSRTPAPPAAGGPAGFSFSDWHVTTGQLDANWQTGNFTTPGRVVLTRPGSDIQADHATGNFKMHQATLTGNVVLHDNNGVLTNFAGQSGQHVPATLTCNNLNIDGTTKTYVATGNVHFTQGSSTVTADRAVMEGVTHDIHLYGNVHLSQ